MCWAEAPRGLQWGHVHDIQHPHTHYNLLSSTSLCAMSLATHVLDLLFPLYLTIR
jgi:hypothetical protein